MCGIAGVIATSPGNVAIDEAIATFDRAMFHRGPNGSGSYTKSDRGFLNRRLAIVDVAGGAQPLYSPDGSVGIVYNGEVYNFPELRRELVQKGHRFLTESDTEVVLTMYLQEGERAWSRLRGMFAICLWDNRSNLVYLVRDQLGVKPLYVYKSSECIAFASELKVLLAQPWVRVTPDPDGIGDYATFRYTQAPLTVFREIRRVPAGTMVVVDGSRHRQVRYYDLPYSRIDSRFEPAVAEERLLSLLASSVKGQLMGEVPVGITLSGGLDSSAIAMMLHREGARLTSFNIGFPELNEFEYSRAVAEQFSLPHREVVTTVEELTARFDSVLWALDEPIADPACFPLHHLAEVMKREVTVVLSGEGSDEIFGGYPQYQRVLAEVQNADLFERFLEQSFYFLGHRQFMKHPGAASRQLRHRSYFEEAPLLSGMLRYDCATWLPENLMMKADKILMAHSLEGRFPFLNVDLIEWAATLPDNAKISKEGISKSVLRRAVTPFLPPSVIARPKMGFSVPVDLMLQALRGRVESVTERAAKGDLSEVISFEKIRELNQGYFRGAGGSPLAVWTWFILLSWWEDMKPMLQRGEKP